MLHPETLYPKTREVLEKLSKERFLRGFYLAGGTALALQLGHRKSIDLDFFSSEFPRKEVVLNSLRGYILKIVQEVTGTLDLLVDDVQVSFLEYKYPMLEDRVEFLNVMMASVVDIGCMKISAISSRGSKKDFVDLYFILQSMTLVDLLKKFSEKFEGAEYSEAHILKSLTYFDDANKDPESDYLKWVNWSEVKDSIIKMTECIVRDRGL